MRPSAPVSSGLLARSAAAAATLALAAPAGAQTKTPGFALDGFDPSVPEDAFFGVASPSVGGHLVPRGTVEMD